MSDAIWWTGKTLDSGASITDSLYAKPMEYGSGHLQNTIPSDFAKPSTGFTIAIDGKAYPYPEIGSDRLPNWRLEPAMRDEFWPSFQRSFWQWFLNVFIWSIVIALLCSDWTARAIWKDVPVSEQETEAVPDNARR